MQHFVLLTKGPRGFTQIQPKHNLPSRAWSTCTAVAHCKYCQLRQAPFSFACVDSVSPHSAIHASPHSLVLQSCWVLSSALLGPWCRALLRHRCLQLSSSRHGATFCMTCFQYSPVRDLTVCSAPQGWQGGNRTGSCSAS